MKTNIDNNITKLVNAKTEQSIQISMSHSKKIGKHTKV